MHRLKADERGGSDYILQWGVLSGNVPVIRRPLPAVAISCLGPVFSEPERLALNSAFEQLTKARRLPESTPPLPDESITW